MVVRILLALQLKTSHIINNSGELDYLTSHCKKNNEISKNNIIGTPHRPIRIVFHTRVRILSIFNGIASNANNLPIISSLG